MTSYLRGWLTTGTSLASPASASIPSIVTLSPPPSDDNDDDDTATEMELDDDSPPSFPSINSAQRVQSQNLPAFLTDSQRMPPPPLPSLASRIPGVPAQASSKGMSLAVPPTTTQMPVKPKTKRDKVALAPGHSPLDWANLKVSGEDLRVSNQVKHGQRDTHSFAGC